MTEGIPLYEQLLANTRDGPKIDLHDLANKVRGITDETHLRLIQVLILHHALMVERKTIPEKPKVYVYGAKVQEGGRGILYQIDKLPTQLQAVLSEFVRLLYE